MEERSPTRNVLRSGLRTMSEGGGGGGGGGWQVVPHSCSPREE